MSTRIRNDLHAVANTKREVRLAGFRMRSDAEFAAAMADYNDQASGVKLSEAGTLPPPPARSEAIFTDGAGYFTVHDTADGPVTLPAELGPKADIAGEAASAGGFVPVEESQERVGSVQESLRSQAPARRQMADATRRDIAPQMPALMAPALARRQQATLPPDATLGDLAAPKQPDEPRKPGFSDYLAGKAAGFAQGAATNALTSFAAGGNPLAGAGSALDAVQGFVASPSSVLSAANLASGAGMVGGELLGMAFGQLGQALFGGVGDDSSMGTQLGAKAGQEALGMAQSELQGQMESAVTDLIDPSASPPTPEADDSTADQISKFLNGEDCIPGTSAATIALGKMGDPTAHGGTMIGLGATVLVNGKPSARVGDPQICPMFLGVVPHVAGPMLQGNPTVLIMGSMATGLSHQGLCCGVGLPVILTPAGPNNVLMGASSATVAPPPEWQPLLDEGQKKLKAQEAAKAQAAKEQAAKEQATSLAHVADGTLGEPGAFESKLVSEPALREPPNQSLLSDEANVCLPEDAIVVGIDGTSSRENRQSGAGALTVERILDDYSTGQENKLFLDGPSNGQSLPWTKGESQRIEDNAYNFIKARASERPDLPIDLYGYSRGGQVVNQVADRLRADGFSVRFLGQLDPVDSDVGYGGKDSIPNNVESATIVAAVPYTSRPYFNRIESMPDNPATTHSEKFVIPASHGALGGGERGSSDLYLSYDPNNERAGRVEAEERIRQGAEKAGVIIRDSRTSHFTPLPSKD